MKQVPSTPKRPEDRVSIGWLRLVSVLYARVYHRLEVESPCRLPRTGAGILICNHTSGLDPILIQAVCPRLIVWMMASEYASIKPLQPIFKATHTILVDRTGRDLSAIRQGLRVLRSGMILGIFPEGKIETNRQLLPFEPGAAMIAMHAKVPVYPAYIDGTQRGVEMPAVFLRRQDARIRFGRPCFLNPDHGGEKDAARASQILEKSLKKLNFQGNCPKLQNLVDSDPGELVN